MSSKIDSLYLQTLDKAYVLSSGIARKSIDSKRVALYSTFSRDMKKDRELFFQNMIKREFLSLPKAKNG